MVRFATRSEHYGILKQLNSANYVKMILLAVNGLAMGM